jgi:hypothetical protein
MLKSRKVKNLKIGLIVEAAGQKKEVKEIICPENLAEGKITFTGYINIPSDAYYTFYRKKNIELEVLIDGQNVLTSDKKMKYGIAGLKKGYHEIIVKTNSKTDLFNFKWSGSKSYRKVECIGAEHLYYKP